MFLLKLKRPIDIGMVLDTALEKNCENSEILGKMRVLFVMFQRLWYKYKVNVCN